MIPSQFDGDLAGTTIAKIDDILAELAGERSRFGGHASGLGASLGGQPGDQLGRNLVGVDDDWGRLEQNLRDLRDRLSQTTNTYLNGTVEMAQVLKNSQINSINY